MKLSSLLIVNLLVGVFVQIPSYANSASFPNDTKTQISSFGNGSSQDCVFLKPVEGFFTKFNHPYGGAGKALVLVVDVANLSYDKVLAVTINNSRRSANFNSSSDQSRPLAKYVGSSLSGVDRFELIDYRVGPEDKIVVDVDVTMGGKSYSCHQIKINLK